MKPPKRFDADNPPGAANDDPAPQGEPESPEQPPTTDSCSVPVSTDKLDLLFMVDNSLTMAQEQVALREQFPRMIAALTTGDPGNGGPSFPPKALRPQNENLVISPVSSAYRRRRSASRCWRTWSSTTKRRATGSTTASRSTH